MQIKKILYFRLKLNINQPTKMNAFNTSVFKANFTLFESTTKGGQFDLAKRGQVHRYFQYALIS